MDFELVFIGKGPERDNLEKEIYANSLQEHVTLLGAIPHTELAKWFVESHVLVLPSYREGVPNVIMEALASGTPVIATSVGGIPEIVVNGLNGILLDSHQPIDIVKAIKHFSTREWISEDIFKTVKCFTWHATSQGLLHTFKVSSDK